LLLNRPSLDDHPGADGRRGPTGHHLHAGNGGDAGQGLAPESEGTDAVKVLEYRNLARRVAGKGQGYILRLDPFPVVGHTDCLAAALLQFHRDFRGPRIQRVLQKFFDDGRRSFDHLTRGNLVGQRLRQNDDFPQ